MPYFALIIMFYHVKITCYHLLLLLLPPLLPLALPLLPTRACVRGRGEIILSPAIALSPFLSLSLSRDGNSVTRRDSLPLSSLFLYLPSLTFFPSFLFPTSSTSLSRLSLSLSLSLSVALSLSCDRSLSISRIALSLLSTSVFFFLHLSHATEFLFRRA